MVGIFMMVIALAAGGWAQDKPKTAQAVAADKLVSFLKEITGWEADGPAEGQTLKTPAGNYTMATRSYTQGEKELEITLIDGAYVPLAYADFNELKEEVGAKGVATVKSIQLAGHPALEAYEPDDKAATLMVLVKDRILVIMDLDGASPKDDLKPLANRLDWKGLEALVSSGK
jgi:hypothetical protein